MCNNVLYEVMNYMKSCVMLSNKLYEVMDYVKSLNIYNYDMCIVWDMCTHELCEIIEYI